MPEFKNSISKGLLVAAFLFLSFSVFPQRHAVGNVDDSAEGESIFAVISADYSDGSYYLLGRKSLLLHKSLGFNRPIYNDIGTGLLYKNRLLNNFDLARRLAIVKSCFGADYYLLSKDALSAIAAFSGTPFIPVPAQNDHVYEDKFYVLIRSKSISDKSTIHGLVDCSNISLIP